MKVELVQFYVKDKALCLYTMTDELPPLSEKDHRLGIYAGEDDEHVYILPLTFGHVLNDDNTPQTKDRIIIGSVLRFIKDTLVLKEPEDHVAETFADMIYQGGSRLE